jgi:hypothetical protein
MAWHCMEWHCTAWHGMALHVMAWHCMALHSMALHGLLGHRKTNIMYRKVLSHGTSCSLGSRRFAYLSEGKLRPSSQMETIRSSETLSLKTVHGVVSQNLWQFQTVLFN